jgi:hypothetical protein
MKESPSSGSFAHRVAKPPRDFSRREKVAAGKPPDEGSRAPRVWQRSSVWSASR